MNKTLCISAAIAMAFSGAALAKGTHSKSSAAAATSQSAQFTAKDCGMLSVQSARDACMRSAARSNGGVDASIVGSTASGSLSHGLAQPGGAIAPDLGARSEAGMDASAVGGTSGAGAMAEGRLQLKSDAALDNSSPGTYSAEHR